MNMHAGIQKLRQLALVSVLVALATAAGSVSTAGATTYDMSGEWKYSLTCSCGPVVEEGVMVVRHMNLTSGEFSGSDTLGGYSEGEASGVVSGANISIEMPFPVSPTGPTSFTMTSGALETTHGEFSGSGYYGSSPGALTGEIKAKKTRSLEAVEQEEKEAAERAKEAKEKAEKEAKEREEKEAAEKPLKEKAEAEQHEREAKEQQEAKARQQAKEQQEATERTEREAREKAAKEAAGQQSGGSGLTQQQATVAALRSAQPLARTLAISGSGVVSFELSNPNGYGVTGTVALQAIGVSKTSARAGRHHPERPMASSFSISAGGKKLVKLRLPVGLQGVLAHRHLLHLVIRVMTSASGQPTSVKTYSLTLHAATRAHH